MVPLLCGLAGFVVLSARGEGNLLKNARFEEASSGGGATSWQGVGAGAADVKLVTAGAHEGQQAVLVPAATAVEQRVAGAMAGAYEFRCWVKSEADEPVTIVLQDPDEPWEAYSCTELPVKKDEWTELKAFCALDRGGKIAVSVGGFTDEMRPYHGVLGKMKAPILVDACELTRHEPTVASAVESWNAPSGTTGLKARHIAGIARSSDGGLVISSAIGGTFKERTVLAPSPTFENAKSETVHDGDKSGIRVTAGDRSYTAWFTTKGLVRIEAKNVRSFQARNCDLKYGILPSLVGADVCYDPQALRGEKIELPSTQWFVGLVDGGDSMMVAAWESGEQAVSLGISGEKEKRAIDTFSIATDKAGFSISFVDHPNIWHREALQEDWLNDYTAIGWQRPFPARWMGEFFVSTGGKPYFDEPYLQYSFPFANANTRMWGVWFEDWNHYPFYFDGEKTMLHFEKGFIPKGDALIYFLEPAAADLYSPVEILEQALGKEKAEALLDLGANQLRQLSYSTPPEFMYDRPVCATTTHLSKIPQAERATVGVNLATHLFEFIREIRGRLDQYGAFFDQTGNYLADEEKSHPKMHDYISKLQAMVTEAKSKTGEIYATPLSAVQEKTEAMKKELLAGKGDGYNCGNLDVRPTAGDQDDLCRHYNRLVMRLTQTAALDCGDSPEKAMVAKHIWEQSRLILRRPVRWESRRTLYFFEP
ncbi:MAG TPA: carbohydrate binding domain-containing protein [Verrucomicrobiae bacterium]|jgi:hypothetical protein